MTNVIKKRCFGGTDDDSIYARYHDDEWGVPVHDDKHLFEMLILEGAQAGLSWETILKKRQEYRRVFCDFNIDDVLLLNDNYLEDILLKSSVVRNRLKVFSVRKNAQAVKSIQREFGSLDCYLWRFVENRPIVNHWKNANEIPTSSKESHALSKDLKKRGMSFVGPTIMYAFMQAVGMVRDHTAQCWKYRIS